MNILSAARRLAVVASLGFAVAATGAPAFVAVQPDVFNAPGALSSAWGDFDNDGDLDLAVTFVSGEVRLYRNDGGIFTNVGPRMGLPTHGDPVRGVSWGDFDRDGYLDLYAGTAATPRGSRNFLYRNEAGAHLTDVAEAVGADVPGVSSRQSSWIDYDNDGDLDLFVAHRAGYNVLLRNDGGKFVDVSEAVGLSDVRRTVGACWFDMDGDGDLDVFLANQEGDKDALYRNDGKTFVDIAPELGMAQPGRRLAEGGVGCAVGDYDNDGDLDLFVATYGTSLLYRNEGHGRFIEVATSLGLVLVGHTVGASWGDFDNDGRLDLYTVGYVEAAGGSRPDGRLWHNEGRRFTQLPLSPEPMTSGNHGVQWADFDRDGDLDLSVTDSNEDRGRELLLRNELPASQRRNSLQVLVLDANGHFTRAGSEVRLFSRHGQLLGTRLVATGDGYNSQGATPVHFGLTRLEPVDIEATFMSCDGPKRQRLSRVDPRKVAGRPVVIEQATAPSLCAKK